MRFQTCAKMEAIHKGKTNIGPVLKGLEKFISVDIFLCDPALVILSCLELQVFNFVKVH